MNKIMLTALLFLVSGVASAQTYSTCTAAWNGQTVVNVGPGSYVADCSLTLSVANGATMPVSVAIHGVNGGVLRGVRHTTVAAVDVVDSTGASVASCTYTKAGTPTYPVDTWLCTAQLGTGTYTIMADGYATSYTNIKYQSPSQLYITTSN